MTFNVRPDKHWQHATGSAHSKWIKFEENDSVLVLCSWNILTISPFQLAWKLKQHFPVNLTMMQPLGASGVLSMFFFFSVWKLDKKKDSESATYQENKFGLCTCYLLKIIIINAMKIIIIFKKLWLQTTIWNFSFSPQWDKSCAWKKTHTHTKQNVVEALEEAIHRRVNRRYW